MLLLGVLFFVSLGFIFLLINNKSFYFKKVNIVKFFVSLFIIIVIFYIFYINFFSPDLLDLVFKIEEGSRDPFLSEVGGKPTPQKIVVVYLEDTPPRTPSKGFP
jgi:hypothetical protein